MSCEICFRRHQFVSRALSQRQHVLRSERQTASMRSEPRSSRHTGGRGRPRRGGEAAGAGGGGGGGREEGRGGGGGGEGRGAGVAAAAGAGGAEAAAGADRRPGRPAGAPLALPWCSVHIRLVAVLVPQVGSFVGRFSTGGRLANTARTRLFFCCSRSTLPAQPALLHHDFQRPTVSVVTAATLSSSHAAGSGRTS